MAPEFLRAEQEAARVLEAAEAEIRALGEPWNGYQVDVELIGSLLFGLGVQRVPDLRVGSRQYAGFLDAEARLIAVEEHHHPHRQRFSIAHEIGHFVLHCAPGGSTALFTCTGTDMEVARVPAAAPTSVAQHLRREAEANRFAGALLMPERPLRAMYRVVGGRIDALVKHFNVSHQAMQIRLEQLGLPVRR